MQPTVVAAIVATAEIATAQAMGADTKKIIALAVSPANQRLGTLGQSCGRNPGHGAVLPQNNGQRSGAEVARRLAEMGLAHLLHPAAERLGVRCRAGQLVAAGLGGVVRPVVASIRARLQPA